ncbi:Rv3235 family protein [Streptomyces sp. NPDC049577]|uniref:Rv3235 family protein n=1 Tax=Streptomyces sp. NPDC049577 TaxID=3155153 RepID=UPI00343C6BF5
MHRTAPRGRTDARRPAQGPAAGRRRREGAERQEPHLLFAHRLLLTLSGQRPVHWMLGHTVGDAYEQLARLACGTPLRPAPPGGAAPVVRACGRFRPRPGVIEAFARIASGERLQALAFRLEHCPDRRWRCAAVELGGSGPGGHGGRAAREHARV